MTNVFAISGTSISSPAQEMPVKAACDAGLDFLGGEAKTYANNLIRDWHAQIVHLDGLKGKSAGNHRDNLFRLLNHAQVAPWELKPVHVTRYFESRTEERHGKALADNVAEEAKKAGFRPIGVEGERDAEWILIELGFVVVHVMLPTTRRFYDLEGLWRPTEQFN